MYARHGRRFDDRALQSYFNSQSWYRPIYSPEVFPAESLLTELEKDNAFYIKDYQDRNGLN
ncbi:MAG: YARHG domain-containing protein [Oscillatoria sp. SIO1A7]|nr:YARHG domain-containing protein [Oscillatoria sp. SIO1A7]